MHAIILLAALLSFSPSLFAFPLTPNQTQTTGDLCDTGDHDFQGYRFHEIVPICRRDVSYDLAFVCRNLILWCPINKILA